MSTRFLPALALLPAAALFACVDPAAIADHHDKGEDASVGNYRKPTIDVGVMVTDVREAEEFYEEVLGFEEIDEFTVSKEVAGDSGLTDYKQFTADVMAIGDGENATRIKLIEMPGKIGARVDNSFVSSTLGPSYLTLHVNDMDPILKAAADHQVKPLAKGPIKIGGDRYLALIRDPDGNFIELVGPRPNFKPVEPEAKDGPAEDAAEEAVEETGDAAEAAGEALLEATEEAAEATGEAAEATEEAVEDE